MILTKQKYEIISPIDGEEILKQIELAARTCYKSEGKIEYEDMLLKSEYRENAIPVKDFIAKSARILIPKLIARKHEAMLEFGGMITVKFTTNRGVSHELVRHRIASFAQESTRYCDYNKNEHIVFAIPSWLDEDKLQPLVTIANRDNKEIYAMGHNENLDMETRAMCSYLYDMSNSEHGYKFQTKAGWTPQQARDVLPNALKTEINISANIREWRHIFKQRTANGAHPDMIALMRPLLNDFKSRIPILFDDINY
ncbi:Flavin-dependent thymidylate synthase [anaerobic digester metagenome]